MIHIGTVHLNGREYSLDLNRASPEPDASTIEASGAVARRNFPTTRSGITLLQSRKAVRAENAAKASGIPTIKDLRRQAQFSSDETDTSSGVTTKRQNRSRYGR